jgi:hypothetical protein
MMIMSALTNNTSEPFIAGAIEYANKVRVAGRNIDSHTKDTLLWYYSVSLHDNDLPGRIAKTLPPEEQIAFLDWLKQGDVSDRDKRIAAYFTAHFTELAGKKADAIAMHKELMGAKPDLDEEITRLSQADLRRLEKR